jgi:hypothetical protein
MTTAKLCVRCALPYDALRFNQLYCTVACRQAAYRARCARQFTDQQLAILREVLPDTHMQAIIERLKSA